jgi:hypothetical protein
MELEEAAGGLAGADPELECARDIETFRRCGDLSL